MTARLLAQTFTVLALITSASAFAAEPADCLYRGEDQLHCEGNIIVAPGTTIQDRTVILITPKDVYFGTPEDGMTITCSDAAGVDANDLGASPVTCGNVYVFASTFHGALAAKTQAQGRAAAPIELHVGFYAKSFRMNLDTEDGLLFVERSGKDFSVADKSLRWASR